MAEAKEVEVQVMADEQDDTENKVSAPKKGNSFSKAVSQVILARRFFDELDDSMKKWLMQNGMTQHFGKAN